MDVERLIWGYIDGELTPEEDQLLRELIARDEQARQLYEAVLSLYIELRRDAETLAPTEPLLHRVEHAVLERMHREPVAAPAPRRRSWRLSLLLLWLLLCAVPLGREQRVPFEQALQLERSVEPQQPVRAVAQPVQRASRPKRLALVVRSPSVESIESSEPPQQAAVELRPAPVLAQELLPSAQPLLPVARVPAPSPQAAGMGERQRPSVPTGMLLSGAVAKPVGTFKDGILLTQAVLYELGAEGYIGIEVGMLLRPHRAAPEPQSLALRSGGSIQGQQPTTSFPPPEQYGSTPLSPNEQVLPSLPAAVPEQLLWGAVLYTRTLLRTDAMALGARLGAGLSSEMPLLTAGLHWRQRIGASGIGIALSADARWLVRQPSVWTTLGAGMWLEL
jgi:hypothetical protein